MVNQSQSKTRALTVQLLIENEADKIPAEFDHLVTSAELEIVGNIAGARKRPDSKYFAGSGKAEQIRIAVETEQADVVVFDHVLSPGQEKNLRELLCCPVIDRTTLILDIFAQRARSFEGRLQVELAQLKHLSVRLIRGWTHLERQKGGIGLRGPGETQLETDRRLIGQRIKQIRHKLDTVKKQREQGRQARLRSGTPTVSVVGYTNAGKSTLFNLLTEAKVHAADQLFATLDPTLRKVNLKNGTHIVLADTVGFIRDLPHELIEAFQATLLENRDADLLLHVVDVSDDEREQRMAEVDRVIHQIGADTVPHITVFNKIDLTDYEPRIEYSSDGNLQNVWLSASTGEGVKAFVNELQAHFEKGRKIGTLLIKAEESNVRALFYQMNAVQNDRMREDGDFELDLNISQSEWGQVLKKYSCLKRRSWCTSNKASATLAAMG